jgi:hypothetical protein
MSMDKTLTLAYYIMGLIDFNYNIICCSFKTLQLWAFC